MRPGRHRRLCPLHTAVCVLMLGTSAVCSLGCEAVTDDRFDEAAVASDATSSDDVDDSGEWSTLVEVDWTLEGGSEAFICALHTVEEDLLVNSFRAKAPPGTHHTVLTMTHAVGPDRVFPCEAGTLSDTMIFASGYGTNDLTLPEGVAIRIPAGKQVLLNLHLVNIHPETRSGRSATLIETLSDEEVVAEAEVIFAGTADFALPPGQEASATGSCVFEQEATVLSLWPHMHQLGRHMVVQHHGEHGVRTLHDAPYSVYSQVNQPIEPLVVRAGERIDVTCLWDNTSDEVVSYGDTASDEMCFVGLYRYPASSTSIYCDH